MKLPIERLYRVVLTRHSLNCTICNYSMGAGRTHYEASFRAWQIYS